MKQYQRESLLSALAWAIEAREKYEREKLKFTGDSAALATYRMMKKDIENNVPIELYDYEYIQPKKNIVNKIR